MMRVESNNAWGTFRQLRLALLRGLTFRLHCLYCRIEVIKSKLVVHYTTLVVQHVINDECLSACN